ncbi:CDP-glucose-4,6-dehydratase [Paraburkholderia hospita]|uniref:CDP-glucose-4,6-dehydratase n=1 Tax=Paraburkholderia hospita TaxID=169430 RepID=A0ABN0FCX8_9BURK|nr:CDP-glucose 4,6-dehydratase [Paraburkholderia hospita]EIM96479.1 CDP-glucose-4,6-dehydratase [Paraburkholderia hospita]OUL93393.1 CDP-glucose 4,6-dehydratase [Paraburkholderia hospita]
MNETGKLDFEAALAGKRILVTGHTGFTGSWACMWLKMLGAEVAGFSLPPDTSPSLYIEAGVSGDVAGTTGDICDLNAVQECFESFQPELVLHLAAQPLVRRSYREPVWTFAANTIGTAHVLEAARSTSSCRSVVCVTTDKVYKNNEWAWPYRENDPMGGKDPYSASKAAAEMVIDSYRYSFGSDPVHPIGIATARGGNIIGGGDWSEDRLIPDFVRAVNGGGSLTLRYPDATRPWQHVLALVQGYLMLLAGLERDRATFSRAWNLGPQDARQFSVREVLEILANDWQRPVLDYQQNPLPEAVALALDSTIARNILGWRTPWDTERVVRETAAWYRAFHNGDVSARELCLAQLRTWRKELHEGAHP